MTTLEFKYGDLVIDDLLDVSDHYFLAVLSETAFFVPTRILMNGINVFEYNDTKAVKVEWIEIPAFSTLLYWNEALLSLPTKRKTVLKIPSGDVEIVLEKNDVRLRSNFSQNTAEESSVREFSLE